jgi:hypothetical protein
MPHTLFQAKDTTLGGLSVEGQSLRVEEGGIVRVPSHLLPMFADGDLARDFTIVGEDDEEDEEDEEDTTESGDEVKPPMTPLVGTRSGDPQLTDEEKLALAADEAVARKAAAAKADAAKTAAKK